MMEQGAQFDRRTVLKGAIAAAGTAALGGGLSAAEVAEADETTGRPPRPWAGPPLRARGVSYDAGSVYPTTGITLRTRESFDRHLVKREMRIIRRDLNCNAVRIVGSEQETMQIAATEAAHAGLEVWFSPWPPNADADAMLAFLAEAATFCERLRRAGHTVVMTPGSEVAISMFGFIPGNTFFERLAWLNPANPDFFTVLRALPGRVNAFLAQAVDVIRARFGGRIAYPALSFEHVDWTPFDIVGFDFYPNLVNGEYVGARAGLESLAAVGKPVAITEFGCTAYDGAAARAGSSNGILTVDFATGEGTIVGNWVRDEQEQADYITGLLDVMRAENVDTAFVCTFASYQLGGELDIASFGIVRMLEEGYGDAFHKVPWEPKAAFWALADYLGRLPHHGH